MSDPGFTPPPLGPANEMFRMPGSSPAPTDGAVAPDAADARTGAAPAQQQGAARGLSEELERQRAAREAEAAAARAAQAKADAAFVKCASLQASIAVAECASTDRTSQYVEAHLCCCGLMFALVCMPHRSVPTDLCSTSCQQPMRHPSNWRSRAQTELREREAQKQKADLAAERVAQQAVRAERAAQRQADREAAAAEAAWQAAEHQRLVAQQAERVASAYAQPASATDATSALTEGFVHEQQERLAALAVDRTAQWLGVPARAASGARSVLAITAPGANGDGYDDDLPSYHSEAGIDSAALPVGAGSVSAQTNQVVVFQDAQDDSMGLMTDAALAAPALSDKAADALDGVARWQDWQASGEAASADDQVLAEMKASGFLSALSGAAMGR